jgi:hypothetical protein
MVPQHGRHAGVPGPGKSAGNAIVIAPPPLPDGLRRYPSRSTMYVIAIGWLYVIVLMALTESSVTAGIASFLFFGLAPVSLLLWLATTRTRRQRAALRGALAAADGLPPASPSATIAKPSSSPGD